MRWPLWRVAVVERSMEPALRPGDWLLVGRPVRSGRRVRVSPGQVVVARNPARPDMLLVKRAARQVGEAWWLASDNPVGTDSRDFGPVGPGLIEGRVLVRYRSGTGEEDAAGWADPGAGPGRPEPPHRARHRRWLRSGRRGLRP